MIEPLVQWVGRWVVALSEPLVSTADRTDIEDHLRALIATNPQWFCAWGAGYLADLIRSLDPEDPWRNLTVENDRALHPDGSPFGTWTDGTDLVPPEVPDLRADLGLAPLRHELPAGSTVLMALAATGWEPVLAWCEAHLITDVPLPQDRAEAVFTLFAEALTWAMYRRRLFTGKEDTFIPVSGTAWTGRAEKMISGAHWDEARAARALEGSKIPEGTYRQFA
ncbi:hypothetical protein V6N00_13880 [Tersicoccus sp. MR15.9]|uniref:hypothetical protein n=1 Tax=Tersicoccus mangrovi TaxID=3121635 RepID=UPI002FE52918